MAAGGVGYWGSRYWQINYWHANYWAGAGAVSVVPVRVLVLGWFNTTGR